MQTIWLPILHSQSFHYFRHYEETQSIFIKQLLAQVSLGISGPAFSWICEVFLNLTVWFFQHQSFCKILNLGTCEIRFERPFELFSLSQWLLTEIRTMLSPGSLNSGVFLWRSKYQYLLKEMYLLWGTVSTKEALYVAFRNWAKVPWRHLTTWIHSKTVKAQS